MCGLVGFFTSFVADVDREKMDFLLMLSTTRGKHSTGVAALTRKGSYNQPKDIDIHYLKSPVVATKFTETPEYRQLTRLGDSKGWMGHTRHATIGAINAENAHPHVSTNGGIIGSHNGSLFGDYPYKKEGATDSEAIMELLSREGEVGLNKIRGAWALTYFNQDNDTFNIIRNAERPLSYVVTAAGDFAYASEAWMLDALLAKYNMTGKVESLPVYQKLTLDLSKDQYIRTLDVAPVEGLEAPKVNYQSAGFFRQRGWQDAYGYSDHWGEDWRESEPAVQQQATRHHSTLPPVQQRTTPATSGGSLITAAQQAREKTAQKAQESRKEVEQKGKVVPLRSSSALVDTSKASSTKNVPRLIKNLPEQQRIDPDGNVEVQTLPGFWIALDEFMDLIDMKACAWSNEMTALDEKRHWINYGEFVRADVWEEDPELRRILGVNPIDGTPENPGALRNMMH